MAENINHAAQCAGRILTVNTGSSSLKVAVYESTRGETRVLSGTIERIGGSGGRFRIADARGQTLIDEARDFREHGAALETIEAWLSSHHPDLKIDAVGHRLVHGGSRYREPQ